MMGGNEILDKIFHLTAHTSRIKADASVKEKINFQENYTLN